MSGLIAENRTVTWKEFWDAALRNAEQIKASATQFLPLLNKPGVLKKELSDYSLVEEEE